MGHQWSENSRSGKESSLNSSFQTLPCAALSSSHVGSESLPPSWLCKKHFCFCSPNFWAFTEQNIIADVEGQMLRTTFGKWAAQHLFLWNVNNVTACINNDKINNGKKNPTNKKNGWIKHKNKSLKARQCKGSVHSYSARMWGQMGPETKGRKEGRQNSCQNYYC